MQYTAGQSNGENAAITPDEIEENARAIYDVWTDGDTEQDGRYYAGTQWEFDDWEDGENGATLGHYTVLALFPSDTEWGFEQDPQVIRWRKRD